MGMVLTLARIADNGRMVLPKAARVGLKANGDMDLAAVVRALLNHPGELPRLIRTARAAGAAFRALTGARDLLGPGLGCPYLVEHPVDMA